MWKLVGVILLSATLWSAGCCMDQDGALREAKARARAGDYATATKLCGAVVSAAPGAPSEPQARLLMAYIASKKRAPESEQIAQFAAVAIRFPSSPEAPEALLRVGYLRDRLKEKPTEWDSLVAKYPDSKEAAQALLCLGRIALRAGNSEHAIDLFRESASVANADPKTAEESRLEAGFAYIGRYWQTRDRSFLRNAQAALQSRTSASAASVSSLSDQDSEPVRAHMGLGEIYLIQGFGNEAAQEYQAVLDSATDDAYTRGVAQYELGCALYTKQDYLGAISAFDVFLGLQPGQSLKDKDRYWKDNRPGYSSLLKTDPKKAAGLSGLELVPDAAYWKASSLVELKRYSEAKPLLTELGGFSGLGIERRVQNLRSVCTLVAGEAR